MSCSIAWFCNDKARNYKFISKIWRKLFIMQKNHIKCENLDFSTNSPMPSVTTLLYNKLLEKYSKMSNIRNFFNDNTNNKDWMQRLHLFGAMARIKWARLSGRILIKIEIFTSKRQINNKLTWRTLLLSNSMYSPVLFLFLS